MSAQRSEHCAVEQVETELVGAWQIPAEFENVANSMMVHSVVLLQV